MNHLNQAFLILFWGASFYLIAAATNNECDKGHKKENKYSKTLNEGKWTEYLQKIEHAEASYLDCINVPESCSCYKHLIDGDLEPFDEIT